MEAVIAFQSSWPWFAIAGVLLVAFRAVSAAFFERIPRPIDVMTLAVGLVLIVVAVLAAVAPYLIVFFGARPA
jgi:hypothetical protein